MVAVITRSTCWQGPRLPVLFLKIQGLVWVCASEQLCCGKAVAELGGRGKALGAESCGSWRSSAEIFLVSADGLPHVLAETCGDATGGTVMQLGCRDACSWTFLHLRELPPAGLWCFNCGCLYSTYFLRIWRAAFIFSTGDR